MAEPVLVMPRLLSLLVLPGVDVRDDDEDETIRGDRDVYKYKNCFVAGSVNSLGLGNPKP